MSQHGTREYRRDIAAIHQRVVDTGVEAVITKDGLPYVKVVPAAQESVLQRLHEEGRISWPTRGRTPVEPLEAGGGDTTEVIADARR